MITATFDLSAGWTFDGEPGTNFGIRFTNGDKDRAYPDKLRFGYDVTVNGETVDTHVWPPENITIRQLTPTRVFPYRVTARPDDVIMLTVWATNAGATVTDETTWTIPRPAQPFPSWTWENGTWTPPAPYPDDDGEYTWDEETGAWIEA
jgi:hypothetical protein